MYHDIGEKKLGTIAHRERIEPTASVLIITLPRLPDVTTLPLSMLTCICGSLPERPVQTTTYIYIYIYIYA